MTTIVYHDGILAADSRQTRIHPDGRISLWHMPKIRATRHFVATGAGCSVLVALLTTLPALLWLRVFRVGLFVHFCEGRLGRSPTTLLVSWCGGQVWVVKVHCRCIGPYAFVYARTRAFDGHTVSVVSGSGVDHITMAEVEAYGAVGAIELAGTRDPHTNSRACAFDTRTWRFTKSRPEATLPLWARLHHAIYGAFPESMPE